MKNADFVRECRIHFRYQQIGDDETKLEEVGDRFRDGSPKDTWFKGLKSPLNGWAAFEKAFGERFKGVRPCGTPGISTLRWRAPSTYRFFLAIGAIDDATKLEEVGDRFRSETCADNWFQRLNLSPAADRWTALGKAFFTAFQVRTVSKPMGVCAGARAACGPDGRIYCTREDAVMEADGGQVGDALRLFNWSDLLAALRKISSHAIQLAVEKHKEICAMQEKLEEMETMQHDAKQ
ncbi:hypothetical protein K438DRAFT_1970620 [Mycena galopus ATCC 62051]|nr:hypothetical protein K438DRAFT_1970620 [Mycena galopus ATCC 62051]